MIVTRIQKEREREKNLYSHVISFILDIQFIYPSVFFFVLFCFVFSLFSYVSLSMFSLLVIIQFFIFSLHFFSFFVFFNIVSLFTFSSVLSIYSSLPACFKAKGVLPDMSLSLYACLIYSLNPHLITYQLEGTISAHIVKGEKLW